VTPWNQKNRQRSQLSHSLRDFFIRIEKGLHLEDIISRKPLMDMIRFPIKFHQIGLKIGAHIFEYCFEWYKLLQAHLDERRWLYNEPLYWTKNNFMQRNPLFLSR
jgi:hypothetical protein